MSDTRCARSVCSIDGDLASVDDAALVVKATVAAEASVRLLRFVASGRQQRAARARLGVHCPHKQQSANPTACCRDRVGASAAGLQLAELCSDGEDRVARCDHAAVEYIGA